MQNLKLNLKHLRYFWAVASHGSIARAAETLYLTPQTISGQLRELEEQLEAKLFQRDGRLAFLVDVFVVQAQGRLQVGHVVLEPRRHHVVLPGAFRRVALPRVAAHAVEGVEAGVLGEPDPVGETEGEGEAFGRVRPRVQGFLFAQPMSGRRFLRWVEDRQTS